jgi:hypothetical protein
MITPWETYLSPQAGPGVCRDYRRRGESSFQSQRACIQRIFAARKPRVIACLGAGLLNDIPYEDFVEADATVHLVDWVKGVTDFGLTQSIVRHNPSGAPLCVYCRLAGRDPHDFCRGYRPARRAGTGVCEAFAATPGAADACLAFRKGKLPYVHQQDVTGGYASAFGAGLAATLDGATSWRQCFKRAIALASRVKTHRRKLAIPDNGVDLVISSMVISQFEHEPYDYFSHQAAALLGAPAAQDEQHLHPLMEKLRSSLLDNQIRGHCDEIERILTPGGRCFMAFEMFHCDVGQDRWYLIEQMHGALPMLAQRFDFDMDGNPDLVAGTKFETDRGRSVVYHLLLAPKGQ